MEIEESVAGGLGGLVPEPGGWQYISVLETLVSGQSKRGSLTIVLGVDGRRGVLCMTTLPDSRWRQKVRSRLRNWYRDAARELPWRQSRDPYSVWISEVMLQQTQVATVIPYFQRFLAAFPDLATLAAASEEQVLKLWEGLGYYRRARQLHQAARVIMRQHGGVFPSDPRAVRDLPGIGRYTAGAILSISRDARQPILEANTYRLLSRWLAFRGDPHSSAGQKLLWEFARQLLPRKDVGQFNQALMELGSEICRPRQPDCESCPVATLCPTQAQGLQSEVPRAKRAKRYEQVEQACVIVWRRRQVLLRRCGVDERWSGLWDFPRFAVPASEVQVERQVLSEQVLKLTGVCVQPGSELIQLKHGVTRFRITLRCYEADYLEGSRRRSDQRWVSPTQLSQFPLSTTGRKIGVIAAQRLGNRS